MLQVTRLTIHAIFIVGLILLISAKASAIQNSSSEVEVRELISKSGMTHHIYELQRIKSMISQLSSMQFDSNINKEIHDALQSTPDINELEKQFSKKLSKKLDKHVVRENLKWWKSPSSKLVRSVFLNSTSQASYEFVNQLRKKPLENIASKSRLKQIEKIDNNSRFSNIQTFKLLNIQKAAKYYSVLLSFERSGKPEEFNLDHTKNLKNHNDYKNYKEFYKYGLLYGLKNIGEPLLIDFSKYTELKSSNKYYGAFFEVYQDMLQQQVRTLADATYNKVKKYSKTVLKPQSENYLKSLISQVDNQANLEKVNSNLHILKLSDESNPAIYCELARIEIIQGSRQVPSNYVVEPGYFTEGSLQKAETYLDKALKFDNKRADTYVLYGYLSFHMRDLNKANKMLDKAEKLGTNNPWLKSNRADVYFYEAVTTNDDKKKKIAIQLYNEVLINEENILNSRKSAARKLSRYYIEAKQYDDAERLFLMRIKMSNEHPWIMQEYAVFLLDHRQNVDGAILYARKALEKRDFTLGRRFLAQALVVKASQELLISKNEANAQKLFKEAKTIYPDLTDLIPYLSLSKTKFIGVRGIYALTGTAPPADNHGTTVLHYAVMSKNYDNIKEVLAMGVDPNVISTEHGAALHRAIFSNNTQIVELLLKNGADPTIPNRDGRTPVEIAKGRPNKDIYNTLLKYINKK